MLRHANPKRAVPILLIAFVFCLVIDNGFKTMTGPMAAGLGISDNQASLQASLAGVIVGVGAVVYAALADAFSIRKLLLFGLALIGVGSVLGFVGSGSWMLVLIGRLIQTSGLAAAETLYVIYVTKYLREEDQRTYLGFSTAAFQAGLLIGALTSGYVADYVSWTAMFLVALAVVLVAPFVMTMVPDGKLSATHLDWVGLLGIGCFATCITLLFQWFTWWLVLLALLGLGCFVVDVLKNPKALVAPEFFRNRSFTSAITLVFLVYSTQLGFIFLLPFVAKEHHGLSQSGASNLMIPGYICAVAVGVLSGAVGKKLSSRTTIFVALAMILGALVLGAVGLNVSVWLLVIVIVLFASGFALLYAPLVKTALSRIPAEKSGIAIGFYNLTINIAIPIGIAYSAKLQDLGIGASALLWVLAGVVAVGIVVYVLTMERPTARRTDAAHTEGARA